jgi:hypothetical protein
MKGNFYLGDFEDQKIRFERENKKDEIDLKCIDKIIKVLKGKTYGESTMIIKYVVAKLKEEAVV